MGRRILTGLLLLILAGCSKVQSIPFDRSQAARIHTIGVVSPSVPERASAMLTATIGKSFGLIGALIDMQMQNSREADFEKAMLAQHFVFRDEFASTLHSQLQSRGYRTLDVPISREKPELLAGYSAPAGASVDAFLDVVVKNYGDTAAGTSSSQPYRPFIALEARLVDARDKRELLHQTVIYSSSDEYSEKIVVIPPGPELAFPDFDGMMARPDNAVGWLRAATAATCAAVGRML